VGSSPIVSTTEVLVRALHVSFVGVGSVSRAQFVPTRDGQRRPIGVSGGHWRLPAEALEVADDVRVLAVTTRPLSTPIGRGARRGLLTAQNL